MTPPQKPDDTSDEIVDMTPANSPQEDSGDIVDLTPMVSQRDLSGETVDEPAPYLPEYETVESGAPISPSMPERTPNERGPLPASRRAPAQTTEELREQLRKELTEELRQESGQESGQEPRNQPPKTGNKRLKAIVLTVLAIVALLYVGHKVLGSPLGSRALGLIGGNSGAQSTPSSSISTPTPSNVQIGNNHDVTTNIGPLILLNPGVVRQGTDVNVTGTGFTPRSVVTLSITRQGSGAALASTVVKADRSGGFYDAAIAVPTSLSAGNFNVVAQERNSSTSAQAIGSVAGGAPQVKLGPQVGQPGDVVTVSLNGFAPEETINVYWNTMSGKPLTTLQANGGGGVGQGQLHVPYGAVGENTFLFVGAKSLSLVAANFLMLNLYPTVRLSSYALKADSLLSFSGKGFGPGEPVLVFLNSTESQPLAVVSADGAGSFKNAPGFVIPYVLKGKQTLIFLGEQSRAPDSVNFTILPYSPVVEPSTYGGLPGTAISFYVTGFAPNEVVHVYAGHTKSTLGNMIACFQTNAQGKAADVGSYLIPGDAQGALGFALVGAKSGGVGTASVNVSAPPAPIQTPAQAPFTCPLDQPAQSSQSSTSATGPQGSVAPPHHQIAAQSAMSPLTRARPEADLAGAVVSPTVMSIVVGVGLVWGVLVMILTCILIWRSYLLAMALPPDATSKAPSRRSTLAPSPRQMANRPGGEGRVVRLAHAVCASAWTLLSSVRVRRITGGQRQRAHSAGPSAGLGAGPGVGTDRERHQVHGRLHFAVPPSAGGRTTIHASRPYRAAHIASRTVSCRRAGWHRLAARAWLHNGDSRGM